MPAGSGGILSWVLIIAVFYFFLIMPERKKQKNMRTMISSVKEGDKIITRGGIYGTIYSLNEDSMVIVTGPDDVKLELSKMSIANVTESKVNEVVAEETNTAEETVEVTETEKSSEEKAE